MSNIKNLISRILNNADFEARYERRKRQYSYIANYIPISFNSIVNDIYPWYCHGLAFRMATFNREDVFERLNILLGKAEKISGWENEINDWGGAWASNFDQFYHFLWMLQCMEYYVDRNDDVQFYFKRKKPAPDLKILTKDKKEFYVECYCYSKWWCFEFFLEDIIKLIDRNMAFIRMYNVEIEDPKETIYSLTEGLSNILDSSNLEKAKELASSKSPYVMFDKYGLKIVMNGKGEYQGNPDNAHGKPSLIKYFREIINSKKNKNDLLSCRPNYLMVNALGIDFQNIYNNEFDNDISVKCESIDKLLLAACGINEKLKDCPRKIDFKKVNDN